MRCQECIVKSRILLFNVVRFKEGTNSRVRFSGVLKLHPITLPEIYVTIYLESGALSCILTCKLVNITNK